MSLLTIIQTAADRLSLARPTVVATSTDQQVRQLLALANEEGEDLSKRGLWQELTTEHTFVTVAAEEQTNTPIPDDLRKFVPNTFFNRTQGRRVSGPITSQQYQSYKAQPVTGGVYLSFRRRQGTFLITPPPPAGDTIAYEYISKKWAQSDAGVAKAAFTADADETYLDEELIIQGIRWRFKAAKGLDYAEDMQTYELSVKQGLADQSGAAAIGMGDTTAYIDLNRVGIPESGFGV